MDKVYRPERDGSKIPNGKAPMRPMKPRPGGSMAKPYPMPPISANKPSYRDDMAIKKDALRRMRGNK